MRSLVPAVLSSKVVTDLPFSCLKSLWFGARSNLKGVSRKIWRAFGIRCQVSYSLLFGLYGGLAYFRHFSARQQLNIVFVNL